MCREITKLGIVGFQVFRLSLVHTTSEEFKNGDFTPITHQMFSVHNTPEELKTRQSSVNFGFVFENSGRKIA